MPSVGLDCQIALDGAGYFVAPGTYSMSRPKQAVITPTRGTPAALPSPAGALVPGLPAPRLEPAAFLWPSSTAAPTSGCGRWTFSV